VTPATPTTLLYPGTTGDAALTVTNPNGFAVTVQSVTANGSITTTATGCSPSSVTFTEQGGAWIVPKRQGTTNGTLDILLAGAVALAADAADACQDATFTIPVRVSTDQLVIDYVGVGFGGDLATSGDGATWVARTSGSTSAFRDVAFGGGRWVAVGDGGTIVTSDDGITWTARSSGTTAGLVTVGYNGALWVAAGAAGTLLTSPDAATWTSRATGVSSEVRGVAWNGLRWLAVATAYVSGAYNFVALNSTDGLTWTAGTTTLGGIADLAWAGTQWVVTGGIAGGGPRVYTSTDGATWTTRTPPGSDWVTRLGWNGTRLLTSVANTANILSSTDNGNTWSSIVASAGTMNIGAFAWGSGQWIAAGYSTIYTSTDGFTWTPHTAPTDIGILYVAAR
jgi:hypothetical protein